MRELTSHKVRDEGDRIYIPGWIRELTPRNVRD
jgi:hypothetical protein